MPDYQPKRFGLKFDPPTIVLEYLVPSTGKLYHHKMRLRNLSAGLLPHNILEALKKRHAMYLCTSKLLDDQLLELIGKLRDSLYPQVDYHTYDLNKLTPEEVQQHKEKMEDLFEKNAKRPGDQDFAYDCRKDFDLPGSECSWDEESLN